MKGYIKSCRAAKPVRKQLNISSFEGVSLNVIESLLPIKYSPLSYNFRFYNGALSTGMGIEQARLPVTYDTQVYHLAPRMTSKILGLWLYRRYDKVNGCRDDRIIIKGEDGKFYETKFFSQDTCNELHGVTTSGKVNTANYRLDGEDVLLISSEYGGLWIYDGVNAPYKVENSPEITSMCIHYERLFATTGGEKNQIWFSDDFNPTNWNISMTEGGFIELQDEGGRANKVISFLDHIYIFRDYGINRLTAYGDQSDFCLTKLFVTSGRIYPDTVAAGGDRVFFLAEDGIYAFDGVSAKRILDNISPLIENREYATACFYDGKYYLALRGNYKDNLKICSEKETLWRNNTVLEFDINTLALNILRGADINCFLPISINNSSILLLSMRKTKSCDIGMLNYSGKFFDSSLPKYWRTGLLDLGHKGGKVLREIYINSLYDITAGIITDEGYSEYTLQGSPKVQKIRVNEKSDKFSFYLKSGLDKAEIVHPALTVDYL